MTVSVRGGNQPAPGVIVVASYLPGETPFSSGRWGVRPMECRGDFDYSHGLAEAWSSASVVVNVEHDVQVNDDLIGALVDCPHPLCAQTYPLFAASGAHGTAEGPIFPYCERNPGPWVEPGVEFAEWAAPGFIKVHPGARRGPFPEKHWLAVEQATNYFVTGRWHLHWPPVEHYHQ